MPDARTKPWLPPRVHPGSESALLDTVEFRSATGFAQNYTAEVRYLGTRGVNLFTQSRSTLCRRFSRTTACHLSAATVASTTRRLPLTLAQLQNRYFAPEYAAAGFNQQAITVFDNRGNSIYHGLAAELNRRFSAGCFSRPLTPGAN